MSFTRWLVSMGLVVALTSLAGAVRADVLPPGGCTSPTDTAQCTGKKAGDACSFTSGSSGNCATLRCTTDGGQPVLQCVATGANPSGGCSAAPGAASGSVGLGTALLLGLLIAARRQARPSLPQPSVQS